MLKSMVSWFIYTITFRWIDKVLKVQQYRTQVVKKYQYDPYRDGFGSDKKKIKKDWNNLSSYNPSPSKGNISSYEWGCDD